MSDSSTNINDRAGHGLRPVALTLFLVVLLAGCGVPAPEAVDDCEGLAGVGVNWVERTAIALEGQPLEVVTGQAQPPEELTELQDIGVRLDARATELGCDQRALNDEIAAKTADLESDDPVVSLFLDAVRSGSGPG